VDDSYINTLTASRQKIRDPFTGVQDGVNDTFVFSATPVAESEQVFYNGVLQYPGVGNDYTISGDTVVLAFVPSPTDRISINFIAA
jgi:hypothetical protein